MTMASTVKPGGTYRSAGVDGVVDLVIDCGAVGGVEPVEVLALTAAAANALSQGARPIRTQSESEAVVRVPRSVMLSAFSSVRDRLTVGQASRTVAPASPPRSPWDEGVDSTRTRSGSDTVVRVRCGVALSTSTSVRDHRSAGPAPKIGGAGGPTCRVPSLQ
jgi:hypothetical protein